MTGGERRGWRGRVRRRMDGGRFSSFAPGRRKKSRRLCSDGVDSTELDSTDVNYSDTVLGITAVPHVCILRFIFR